MKMSKFQIILIAVFGIIIIVSVIVFSRFKGSSREVAYVEIWGSIPQIEFSNILSKTSLQNNKTLNVTYKEKNPETFDNELLEALASDKGPDLFVLPHDKIFRQKNKITLIPFSAFSERTFKNSFVEGAEIFLDSGGVVALPIFSDPLVMYWNREIFKENRMTEPPKHWDEFYNLAANISKKDGALNITRSAVAMGEFANVANAKEILANLLLQAGTPIVSPVSGSYRSVLSNTFDKPIMPAEAAVNFYTEFSNPVKPFYSWNRSMPKSGNYFLGGDLAIYFGFGSELPGLQKKNPNLNFDVALVPTSREGGVYVSYGKFYGLSISKGSRNPSAALQVAYILSSAEGAKATSEVLNLPPVRRDLLSQKPADSYKEVFYISAIRAKAWLDPEPKQTATIFGDMVESITSGRERTISAVSRASNEINNLFPR